MSEENALVKVDKSSRRETAIEQAKRMVEACFLKENREERVQGYHLKLKEAEEELKSLLPIEGQVVKGILERKIRRLKYRIADPEFEERYPLLSMEVLKMRNAEGFPVFAPFFLDCQTFSLYFSGGRAYRDERGGEVMRLPSDMRAMYQDIFAKWKKEANSVHYFSAKITAQFSGVIPQAVRKRIEQVLPDFQPGKKKVSFWNRFAGPQSTLNIFLLAEVRRWEVDKVVIQNPDPLVVGYRYGELRLIDHFDETPMEEYIRREFTL